MNLDSLRSVHVEVEDCKLCSVPGLTRGIRLFQDSSADETRLGTKTQKTYIEVGLCSCLRILSNIYRYLYMHSQY